MSQSILQRTTPHSTPRTAYHLRCALLALGMLSAAMAFAGDDHDHGEAHDSHATPTQVATSAAPTAAPAQAAAAAELSEGEVLRWDARSGKVTLRHGPIANLGMPPMTMVFKVQNADQGSALQTGMKVRFRAEQLQGAYVLTHIAPAP
ncbi:copper-binding protein [Acidovorax sp. 106]|uniref:copper-binding protein n=1 Tax=Acidovorax sp. 106 TaxID=2135637 RepID=UPI000EACA881|nr:copper-binding protein [Acidovorax sp. 106]RLJ36540.1 Cu/Ag efflux protein CusF [Acidovorax sp. 106]